MPKRKVMDVQPMTLESRQCIFGGACGVPVILPIVQEGGVSCLTLNGYDNWLNLVVEGVTRGKYSQNVIDFLDELRDKLSKNGQSTSPGRGESCAAEDGESCATPLGKEKPGLGRAALGLDSDSDEEDLGEACPVQQKKTPRSRNNDFQTVQVQDFTLVVKRRSRGKGILVRMDGSDWMDVLSFLRNKASQRDHSDNGKRPYRKQGDAAGAGDGKRLRWNFQKSAYEIRYCDVDGQFHSTTKGFCVNRVKFDGTALSPAEFSVAQDVVRSKAMRAWNELDKTTTTERFDV